MWLCLFAYSKYFGVVHVACLQVGGKSACWAFKQSSYHTINWSKNGFLASDIFDVSLCMMMKKIEPSSINGKLVTVLELECKGVRL